MDFQSSHKNTDVNRCTIKLCKQFFLLTTHYPFYANDLVLKVHTSLFVAVTCDVPNSDMLNTLVTNQRNNKNCT